MTLREARQLVFALLRRDPGYAGDAWERTMEIDKAIRADERAKERENVLLRLEEGATEAMAESVRHPITSEECLNLNDLAATLRDAADWLRADAVERGEHNTEGEDAE